MLPCHGRYIGLIKFENALDFDATDVRWKTGGYREAWLKEVKGPVCTVKHAASCLLNLELVVLQRKQVCSVCTTSRPVSRAKTTCS